MSDKRDMPHFNNPQIAAAVSELAQPLQHYQEALDKLSADIRVLETHLRAYGVCVPIKRRYTDEDAGLGIGWLMHRDQFRLCYIPMGLNNSLIMDQAKPLLECKLAARIDCFKLLPNFVRDLTGDLAEVLPDLVQAADGLKLQERGGPSLYCECSLPKIFWKGSSRFCQDCGGVLADDKP